LHIRPLGFCLSLFERLPMPICLEPPFQHELRLLLLGRNDTDSVFIKPLRDLLVLDISDKTPLVILLCKIANGVQVRAHCILPDATLTVGTKFPSDRELRSGAWAG